MDSQPPNQPYRPTSPSYPPNPAYYQQAPHTPQPSAQYQPQPPRKKARTVPLWLFIVSLFLVGGLGYGAGASANANQNHTTASFSASSSSQPTSAPATPTPTPRPTPTPKWTTVQTFSGNGTKKTAVFTVPDDWKLFWTCNPASFMAQYNVIIEVHAQDTTLLDLAINTLCKPGNTGGETEEHQAGQVYLDVNSEAAWTATIQELK